VIIFAGPDVFGLISGPIPFPSFFKWLCTSLMSSKFSRFLALVSQPGLKIKILLSKTP
jgi:hypothetical protein